ncbi:asparaginase [Cohnella thailandensis]|uniref:asparaginase n=1 Tax=Cohnella thailandensis TaxID=557557 RepID=A0A841SXS1_9BACL|nr:asparaginase [Cohnella thailandensis]MBB6633531.1 asparaginase [Cohnella thailandensis]MBP1974548.1 L-asparaginase [Cohnella thailandensis]
MSKIKLLTTGGTIAMSHDASTGKVDRPTNDVLSGWLNGEIEVVSEDVCNKSSPQMTLTELNALLRAVRDSLANPEIDGVVVTHGTDTLEETAYFLDLQLPWGKPVIVTGAMKASNDAGTDGPVNLMSAVYAAASGNARSRGVLVVMQDQIHAARYVTKTHTSSLLAFQSPESGPIGWVRNGKAEFRYSMEPAASYEDAAVLSLGSVFLVKAVLDMGADWLEFALSKGAEGIVLEAFGQGNVPPSLLPGIERAIAAGIPVVLVSRCIGGEPQGTYAYEGGGAMLTELGVVFARGLNGPKARLKLAVLLASKKNAAEIKAAFE